MLTTKVSVFLILLTSLTIVCSIGCKQGGCTDKAAINYSNTADKDDGSCLYCKTTIAKGDSFSVTMKDNNSVGGQYMVDVIKYTFTNYSTNYNSKRCGTDSCKTMLTIQNLVNWTTCFSYNIQYLSPALDTMHYHINIPPYQSVDLGVMVSNPTITSCGIPHAIIYLEGQFLYY